VAAPNAPTPTTHAAGEPGARPHRAAPTVLVSSVVRATDQGESHGGVYLVDLEARSSRQVIDWNDAGISWEGRGADRGLRGIAFAGGRVYLAASDEIFVYDPDFRQVGSFRNPYLKHAHEICIAGGSLFATSTGFDSVLELDLESGVWVRGWCLRRGLPQQLARRLGGHLSPRFRAFDPTLAGGPDAADTSHLNMVSSRDGVLYVAGTKTDRIYTIADDRCGIHARIPLGCHNAQPIGDHVIVNHTRSDRICLLDRSGAPVRGYALPAYDEAALVHGGMSRDLARPGFGRGLVVLPDGRIVGGSSPATVSLYEAGDEQPATSVNLSMDVRNAIHGLAVWPFPTSR
jgi:hypothetical protein